jgi:hypothetical protein
MTHDVELGDLLCQSLLPPPRLGVDSAHAADETGEPIEAQFD